MRIGILFGGPSREREIAFAGGRTVYDNLDKALFEPVPVFIDSKRNFILLNWPYIYKGTIRDFYPPVPFLPESPHHFQIYIESLQNPDDAQLDEIIEAVGQRIQPHELPGLMDFAFLALHGNFGEDGQIQGLLDSFNVPYSGSGILPSAVGVDKAFQKRMFTAAGMATPEYITVKVNDWQPGNYKAIYNKAIATVGNKLVVKPARQGSSIGISILKDEGFDAFVQAMDKGFFRLQLTQQQWQDYTRDQQVNWVRQQADIRDGLGLPVLMNDALVHHPETLLERIDRHFEQQDAPIRFQALDAEREIIIESMIEGKEFSCIVIRDEQGKPMALPPTHIIKGGDLFDYRSKYLAGLSRKVTPIQVDDEVLQDIRSQCEELFSFFGFHVYARIDGFISNSGQIYLNDPNTTSGMLPSSFFFHQAAEIGLNPSQYLTYLIRTSLSERISGTRNDMSYKALLAKLDERIAQAHHEAGERKKIAVILGGFSSERHISVESGRNIFEKLSSGTKYEPVPVFLTGKEGAHELYRIPVNILLKDNADDIRDKVKHYQQHPVLETIRRKAQPITEKYTGGSVSFKPEPITYQQLSELVDGVFIALHGRPGEDGAVQAELEKYGVPYNGSGVQSSQTTINKYATNQMLKEHGFKVAEQCLYHRVDWEKDADALVTQILKDFELPLIAKPVDDGCSSAVKRIDKREQLQAFLQQMFRDTVALNVEASTVLGLKPNEEFPRKQEVLIESLIDRGDALYFLEITGGLLTRYDDKGELVYEVFEPSEALAGGGVLSLEEKFLAGEGQNITPARFGKNATEYDQIARQVKADLEKVARLTGVEGYCRIDAFVRVQHNMEVETIIIEVNSLPGMTPATCIFHQAAINGYKPFQFIDQILEFSFQKQQHLEGTH